MFDTFFLSHLDSIHYQTSLDHTVRAASALTSTANNTKSLSTAQNINVALNPTQGVKNQNLKNLLLLRAELQNLAKEYEEVRRWQIDYKKQAKQIQDDKEAYSNQLGDNASKIANFGVKKSLYIKNLHSLIYKGNSIKKEVMEEIFSDNITMQSEVRDDKAESSYDNAIRRLSAANLNKELREQNANHAKLNLIIDLLEYQVQNYKIDEVIELLDQNIISKAPVEIQAKAFTIIYPFLSNLGYTEEINSAFQQHNIPKIIGYLFNNEKIEDVSFQNIRDIILKDVASVVNNDSSLEEIQTKLKLYLSLKGQNITKLHDDNKNNILHLLIDESSKLKLGDSNHSKAVVMVDAYIKLFESTCESFDKQILAKLLRQRNKDGETPAQLFYRLAKKDQQKENVIHTYNQNGIKWFKTILRYTGTVDIPSKSWHENSWYIFIVNTALAITSKYLIRIGEKSIKENAGIDLSSGGNSVVDVLKESIFVASLSPQHSLTKEEWNKFHVSGHEEMHYLNLDGINFIGIMNTGDFSNDSSIENITKLTEKIDSQKDKLLGGNKYILNYTEITSKADQFTIKEKLDHHKILTLRYAFIKEALNSIENGTYRSSWLTWFIGSNIDNKKLDLHTQLQNIQDALNASYSTIKNHEFQKLLTHIETNFAQLFAQNKHNSQSNIEQMAYSINLNAKSKHAFDKFYKAVDEGLIPLNFVAFEKLNNIFNEVKAQRLGKEIKEDIKNTAQDNYSALGNNLITMMNNKITVNSINIDDNALKENSFTLSDFIYERVSEKFSEDLVSFNPLIEKETWLNKVAHALHKVSGIDKSTIVKAGIVVGSRASDIVTSVGTTTVINAVIAAGGMLIPGGSIMGALGGVFNLVSNTNITDQARKSVLNAVQVNPTGMNL